MKCKTVQDIYAQVPDLDCQGKCQEVCGVIPIYPAEEKNLQAHGLAVPRFDENLTCTALKNGKCSIYQDRPLICRIWGNTPKMPCPWGCKPKRFLTEKQSISLFAMMRKLSRGSANIFPKHDSILLAPVKNDQTPSLADSIFKAGRLSVSKSVEPEQP